MHRDVYLEVSLSQIPRVLSLQDRGLFSKTYGSFHRSHWLHRTADFPSAISQMGAQILALVWKHPFGGTPYHRNPKILEWSLAGIRYWMRLQHRDGSFDEWYPNERGWAGPTGYLLHAMADSYLALQEVFPEKNRKEFIGAVRRAGRFLADYHEEFVLANHHALALLAIYESFLITQDPSLLQGFEKKWVEFQKICDPEGWSLEYDGADIGYLSGTVSFLSRLYRHRPEGRIEEIIRRGIEFTSFFLYPDGFFGGTVGSRQTSHFYPFGYEFWSRKNPLAARMAQEGLRHLSEGKLVPPAAQEDHYALYRVAEHLEAYLAYQDRPDRLPPLPWEGEDFKSFFPGAGILIRKKGRSYTVLNLKRGGVLKAFDVENRRLVLNDSGWIGRLKNGRAVTSQWNDPEYRIAVEADRMRVAGHGHRVVMKTFNPWTMILFRLGLIVLGWHPLLATRIKAWIRRLLMVGVRRTPVWFERTVSFSDQAVTIQDDFRLRNGVQVDQVLIGDEFSVRYVPQSRYFQSFELEAQGRHLTSSEIERLNREHLISITRVIPLGEEP